jgi:acetylornithine deacetylase/succinyl-diaminopimelate desuccinylase family protein
MSDSTIKLLRDLIAIDSVNPSLVPGGAGEAGVAARAAAEMQSIGLDVEVAEAAPGRPNVVGVMEAKKPGPSLMFCGHLDTVGVEGMKAPFDPVERDGRIYGRGSQDMKGGVAAMIGAARTLASSGGLSRGRLIVAGVVDEEYASIGADALVTKWHADAAVVTEPTDLIIAVGHKGFSWIEVTVLGRAAHGSRPSEGRDAIIRMGRVLSRLEQLDRELQSKTPHAILGTGSLHGSFINGGRELSTYPDRCVLQFERRTITGESGDTALAETQKILESIKAEDQEFDASARLLFSRPPYETPAGHSLPLDLEHSLREVGRRTHQSGMTFWTDAAVLGNAGTPSVVFGPGGHGLHSLEEYVLADEVLICQEALVKLAERFLRSQ